MAFILNGIGDYFPLGFTPVNTLPFTMACWFNPDDVATAYALMSNAQSASTFERYRLMCRGDSAGDPVTIEARNQAGTSATASTTTSVQAGVWQHAAGVVTSTTSRKAFLNGGGSGSNSTSISFAGALNSLDIGRTMFGGTTANLFKGKIAEAAMWDVALTDEEIFSLAQGASPNLIRPNRLWFYAPLIDGLQNLRGGILGSAGSPTPTDHIPITYPRSAIVGLKASALNAASAIHSHTATSPVLSGPAVLTPDAGTHSHASTSPAITPHDVVAPADSTSAHSLTSPSLQHVPGAALATLPSTPTVRYRPDYSGVTVGGDGRVLSITDLMGLANAAGSAGNGPKVGVDPYGRKYLDFNFDPNGAGQHWLVIPTTLADVWSQSTTVFAVGRFFSQQSGVVFSIGQNGNSPPAMSSPLAQCTGPGLGLQQRPYVGANTSGSQSTKIGTQLCVLGFGARQTANGGFRVAMNRQCRSPGTAVALASATGQGAEIGRNAYAPSGTFLNAHIYELVIFTHFNPDNATFDAIATALADAWEIPEVTHDVVVEGDSISAGVDDRGIARWLSEPVTGLPATTRVVMSARSGSGFTKSTTQSPTYRRDLSGSCLDLALYQIPGDTPQLTIQIGRNDITNDATADTAYNNLVAYLNTTTNGVLQRGFKVVVGANIAEGSTLGITNSVLRLRNKILAPQFLVDCNAGPGQTYDGKLRVANLSAIVAGAKGTVFYDLTDTTDSEIYQPDGLHPWEIGEQYEVYGGDTPWYGYKANLTAVPTTVANESHAHSLTSPTVSAAIPITPADASHVHLATIAFITASSVISPAAGLSGHVATSPTLSTASPITPAASIHAHQSDSPLLSVAGVITVASATSAHIASSPSLGLAYTLAPNGAVHAHFTSQVSIRVPTMRQGAFFSFF